MEAGFYGGFAQRGGRRQRLGGGLFQARVKTRDLVVFAQQLATLIESGISIVRALHLLAEQAPSKRLRELLNEIVVDIQQGRPFISDAIAKHPRDFPTAVRPMAEVGERAGNLESVLRQMATYMEKEEALSPARCGRA